ncbi:MAG: calcium/sodium antiporter [Vicinamibacteria bacterium]|jgi:cation:H+ antiporter|nr:calcium/sodium antiporter [Vicinamibacteria bacterium]
MIGSLLLVLAGVSILALAGNQLVDYAVAVAVKARVTPAVVGLTVVAWGTSTPEAFVSVVAAWRGSTDIAMANVIGSNIANVGLILGLCALITVIPVARTLLRLEYPFLLLASWIALLLCRDGWLDRLESLFFLVSVVAFTVYVLWLARRQATSSERESLARSLPNTGGLARRPTILLVFGLVLSLIGLGVGAHLLVAGAVAVARGFGVSERIIGLTLVAIGTSLPELVASIAAASKRQMEMAVTNIVGSNICNILLILSVTGLIRPIACAPQLVAPDMWVMFAMAALIFPLVVWDLSLTRRDGAVLLSCYVLYIVLVVSIR